MLSGYKTYITAGFGILLAAGSMFGVLPAGVNVDPTTMLVAAFGLIFARVGAVKPPA